MLLRRSQLFVPANDEKKIRKSLEIPCDSIVFDLEDGVPEEGKAAAREHLRKLLRELEWGEARELCLRINPRKSPHLRPDLDYFAREEAIDSFVIPKAQDAKWLSDLHGSTGKKVIPLVETGLGLLRIEDIVRAEGVDAVSFGAADFANSIGGTVEEYSGNIYVKTLIAVAAKSYGVDPIDCVFFDLVNLERFQEEALKAKGLGYVGKQVVHPTQVQSANEVFSPTRKEVQRAWSVVEAYEAAAKSGSGAIRIDEQLVDAVHYRQAKLTLERNNAITEKKF